MVFELLGEVGMFVLHASPGSQCCAIRKRAKVVPTQGDADRDHFPAKRPMSDFGTNAYN